jgi:hypothetical protein
MLALSRHCLGLLLLILILLEGRAYAYIDPGTGFMLWQLLVAAGVGSLFYVRKAISWMGRLRERKKPDGAHHSAGTPSLKTGREAGESPPLSPEDN